MYQIDIHNSQDALALDEPFLRQVAERTLADERVAEAEISIAIVDDPVIRELNRRYLDHDYETDVLSFLLNDELAEASAETEVESQGRRGAGRRIEGEVIVSAETACRSAAGFGWSPHDELVLYLVHGLLHLTGYDDLTDDERTLMRSREREVLRRWNLAPRYADDADDVSAGGRAGRPAGASGAEG